MGKRIVNHRDLDVFRKAFDVSMEIFECSRSFPIEERYSLTDQIRRASRSVSANIAEAWRKRRYEAAFVSKLSDAETEAAETQVWLEYAVRCGYIQAAIGRDFYRAYAEMIRTFVGMINHPKSWILPGKKRK